MHWIPRVLPREPFPISTEEVIWSCRSHFYLTWIRKRHPRIKFKSDFRSLSCKSLNLLPSRKWILWSSDPSHALTNPTCWCRFHISPGWCSRRCFRASETHVAKYQRRWASVIPLLISVTNTLNLVEKFPIQSVYSILIVQCTVVYGIFILTYCLAFFSFEFYGNMLGGDTTVYWEKAPPQKAHIWVGR